MALSPFSRSRRPGAVDGGGLDAPGSVFLGSLRSEFDEEIQLHPSFSALLAAASAVRAAYITNRLTPEDAATAFGELVLFDSLGGEWTIGASSGRWYRRRVSGGVWEPAATPSEITPDDSRQPRWLAESVSVLFESRPDARVRQTLADQPVEAERPILPLPDLPDPEEEMDWLFSEWQSGAELTKARAAAWEAKREHEQPQPADEPRVTDPIPLEDTRDVIEWVAPEKYWWRAEDALSEDAASMESVGDLLSRTSPSAGMPQAFPDDVAVKDLTGTAPTAPVERRDTIDHTDDPNWVPALRDTTNLHPGPGEKSSTQPGEWSFTTDDAGGAESDRWRANTPSTDKQDGPAADETGYKTGDEAGEDPYLI